MNHLFFLVQHKWYKKYINSAGIFIGCKNKINFYFHLKMHNEVSLISVIFQVKYKNSHNFLAHFWNNFSHDNVHCHLQKRKMSNSFLINLSLIIDWCPRKRNWSVINFAKVFSSFLERWKYVFIRYAVWRKRIKGILERKATNFQ